VVPGGARGAGPRPYRHAPAAAASGLGNTFVKKPIFGREGHNVTVTAPGLFDTAPGSYGAEGYVWQAYQPLPSFDGNHALVGSWVVDGKAAGVGMREDERRITHNNSRFVPHYFM
jgi:glutathionylspermidine synthase